MSGKLFGYLAYSKYGINKQNITSSTSSTGNIYGIYNLANNWEWTAGYVETTSLNYETYAGELKGESDKYKTRYEQISNINEPFIARGGEDEETSSIEILSVDNKEGSGALDISFRPVLVIE